MKSFGTILSALLVAFALYCFWTGQAMLPAIGFILVAIWVQTVAILVAIRETIPVEQVITVDGRVYVPNMDDVPRETVVTGEGDQDWGLLNPTPRNRGND